MRPASELVLFGRRSTGCQNISKSSKDVELHLFICCSVIYDVARIFDSFVFCVTQDFEAVTPNLLARTIETVEGGGIVVLLLRTMNSLKQLYTMIMVSV